MDIVHIEQVSKIFQGHTAVDRLSFRVPPGVVYGILGPNGAGKTTTLRMILDIYRPDEGSISVFGERPGLKVQRRMGYLPEERGLYRKMKVLDQLIFLGRLKGLSYGEAKKKALSYLETLGLLAWKDKKVEQLSKGMQQKVQFIGTILHEPDLLILDEPFSGLDPLNQQVLLKVMQSFVDKGKTILFSTHILSQAEKLCSHICLINRGRKVLEGDLKSLKESYRKNRVYLEYEGENTLPHTLSVEKKENGWVVELPSDISAEGWLSQVVAQGFRVRHFAPLDISLEEIFLEVVSDDPKS